MNAVLRSPALLSIGGEPRRVRVALAGCGTVGSALIRLLRERAPAIEREHGLRFEITGVLVRNVQRPRIVESAAGALTRDVDAWLGGDADLVVEATGAVEVALRIARATLARGRCFVTANKALIAAHGPELAALARAHRGRLHFEAAVGGGVPVIRVLREALRHTGVRSVRGVLNGTSNFVLGRMAAGHGLDDALYEARVRGFAEADASRDLDGRDAADKIAILAWLAFGSDPAALPVQRRSLLPDTAALVRLARAQGGVLRQVAECFATDGVVSAAVEPVIVAPTSPLALVQGEENGVLVETRGNGSVRLFGPGAGGPPTAAALLSDMLQGSAPEPGARAASPIAGEDPRRHTWALATSCRDAGVLLRAADASGVPLQWVRTQPDGEAHALTLPAAREPVQACAARLEAECGSAAAVRVETA